jgi:HD-GYP domain-containing protein (c-di-GMP phosphodiesterase class II)
MSDTQELLGKIAALRQRLEQARGLVEDAGSAAAALVGGAAERADPVHHLSQKVALGAHHSALLDSSLRQAPAVVGPAEQEGPLPSHLTARACRLLPRVRDLLGDLRQLADDPLLGQGEGDPLAAFHREMMALAELTVRVLQTLPETPSLQLRVCEGVEAVVKCGRQRVAALAAALEERRAEEAQIDTLAELLTALAGGSLPDLQPLLTLAAGVQREAAEARPLHFLSWSPAEPARFVAAHSLNVARVLARVTRHAPELRGQVQPVLAGLVYDVGMVAVPAEVLSAKGPLDEAQRRAVEAHAAAGGAMLTRLGVEAWLTEAATCHHERLDGTGYPAGLSDLQIGPLPRLLAAADVYTALCSPRPHRTALEPRTALTDTLMLAEQGALDRECAKSLLELGLYPVGTAVELADGACGLVVATLQSGKDISACARPVVFLLTDGQGKPLPYPCHVNLAQGEGRSIVRGLPASDRRQVFGPWYPEWA